MLQRHNMLADELLLAAGSAGASCEEVVSAPCAS